MQSRPLLRRGLASICSYDSADIRASAASGPGLSESIVIQVTVATISPLAASGCKANHGGVTYTHARFNVILLPTRSPSQGGVNVTVARHAGATCGTVPCT